MAVGRGYGRTKASGAGGGERGTEQDAPVPGRRSLAAEAGAAAARSAAAAAYPVAPESAEAAALPAAPAHAEAAEIAALGPGRPVEPAVRAPVEQRLRISLADARVHDSPAAHALAQTQRARAFAYGRDIVLGAGESALDAELMAHELTHVAQQRGGSPAPQHLGGTGRGLRSRCHRRVR